MPTVKEQTEAIRQLHPAVRMAGYLARVAALAELGARLRTRFPDDNFPDKDQQDWDRLSDECDPWYDALSEPELYAVRYMDRVLGPLTCGELPADAKLNVVKNG